MLLLPNTYLVPVIDIAVGQRTIQVSFFLRVKNGAFVRISIERTIIIVMTSEEQ